jgi:hypothetical protein
MLVISISPISLSVTVSRGLPSLVSLVNPQKKIQKNISLHTWRLFRDEGKTLLFCGIHTPKIIIKFGYNFRINVSGNVEWIGCENIYMGSFRLTAGHADTADIFFHISKNMPPSIGSFLLRLQWLIFLFSNATLLDEPFSLKSV